MREERGVREAQVSMEACTDQEAELQDAEGKIGKASSAALVSSLQQSCASVVSSIHMHIKVCICWHQGHVPFCNLHHGDGDMHVAQDVQMTAPITASGSPGHQQIKVESSQLEDGIVRTQARIAEEEEGEQLSDKLVPGSMVQHTGEH